VPGSSGHPFFAFPLPVIRNIMKKKNTILNLPFLLTACAVAVLAVISLMTGEFDISGSPEGRAMFFITRIPRTVSLLLTGAAMSVSGVVMQFITQNRMVEPTTTGTIEWAGLGLLLVYILIPSPSLFTRMTAAIVFSFAGTMIFFLMMQRIRLKSSVIVPIVGMMIGAVVSALSTFLGLQFQASQVVENWFVGSFSGVQIGRYEYLWLIVAVSIAIYLYADRIAIAGLGRDIATNLGVSYTQVVLIGTGLISLATGIVAAVIGNLPFLGLIIPNLVSMIRGDELKSNLPWVALLGMGSITLCDILSRVLIRPFEIPVSMILGTVGAAVFIVILLRQRKKG
jgi:iron complex transport system permease protein